MRKSVDSIRRCCYLNIVIDSWFNKILCVHLTKVKYFYFFCRKTILVISMLSTIAAYQYCNSNTDKQICAITVNSAKTDDLGIVFEDGHRYFYCVSCDIVRFPSFFTDGFRQLLRIDFSNSHMKILELKTKQPAYALKSFNVSHNDISNKLTNNSLFITADHLQWIDLSYNKISDICSDVFNCFESLKQIDLSFNLIENLDGFTFFNLNALEILKFNNNLLHSIRLRFNKVTSLTNLDVSFNAIETIEAEEFSNMPNLMNLQLSNNKIRSIDAQILLINLICVFWTFLITILRISMSKCWIDKSI